LDLDLLEILKVVAPHGSLRHLVLPEHEAFILPLNNQEEWKIVFSQICAKLTTFELVSWNGYEGFCWVAPLINAKHLATLELATLPPSETFRKMADNYTCLQNVEFLGHEHDCSEYYDMAYFFAKQRDTLTSLKISTSTPDPLPAISKCRNLKKLHLISYHSYDKDDIYMNLKGLGSLSNLKCLCLEGYNYNDVGHSIEAAKFQHLNEIQFIFVVRVCDNDVSQISRTYGQQV
jgi:hypothetical protein